MILTRLEMQLINVIKNNPNKRQIDYAKMLNTKSESYISSRVKKLEKRGYIFKSQKDGHIRLNLTYMGEMIYPEVIKQLHGE